MTKIDKNGKEVTKTISYRLQFTDSTRFIASLLSNLVDNLAEGIHKIHVQTVIHVAVNTQTLMMI